MPRPKRPRHIISRPGIRKFGPEGMDTEQQIVISLEEVEAVRLIDYEGMDQSGAAQIMNVSRQTVGRILKLGRFKLAKAVVEGHRLKVQGGCYKVQNSLGRKFGGPRRCHGRKRGRETE